MKTWLIKMGSKSLLYTGNKKPTVREYKTEPLLLTAWVDEFSKSAEEPRTIDGHVVWVKREGK